VGVAVVARLAELALRPASTAHLLHLLLLLLLGLGLVLMWKIIIFILWRSCGVDGSWIGRGLKTEEQRIERAQEVVELGLFAGRQVGLACEALDFVGQSAHKRHGRCPARRGRLLHSLCGAFLWFWFWFSLEEKSKFGVGGV
jgi:hypothetical protein